MYLLTALLSIGCFIGVFGAIQHRLWWLIPFLVLGGLFFFVAAPGDDDD